jgi:short-chain fatty acids transporter
METGIVDRLVESTEWVFHPYPLMLTGMALVYASVMLWLLTPPTKTPKG